MQPESEPGSCRKHLKLAQRHRKIELSEGVVGSRNGDIAVRISRYHQVERSGGPGTKQIAICLQGARTPGQEHREPESLRKVLSQIVEHRSRRSLRVHESVKSEILRPFPVLKKGKQTLGQIKL